LGGGGSALSLVQHCLLCLSTHSTRTKWKPKTRNQLGTGFFIVFLFFLAL